MHLLTIDISSLVHFDLLMLNSVCVQLTLKASLALLLKYLVYFLKY